jgi:O-acetyl-ADP-ribose deacetylase (regulator of RNase III)
MIKVIKGDLLDSSEYIIGHQVNCMGVMGAGIAKQIKDRYSDVFNEYQKLCSQKSPADLLGDIQKISTFDLKLQRPRIVINIFGQKEYGRSKVHTDYAALFEAMLKVKEVCKDKTIGLPYYMGCGLGGGRWDIVMEILEAVFPDDSLSLYKL